jgi:hypothetical protein
VGAFGVVEPQRPREGLEHGVRDATRVAALQAPVVLDAHTGQRGDLLAAQTLHPARAIGWKAHLLRGDVSPPRGEELGDVVGRVHSPAPYPGRSEPEVPCQYPSHTASQVARIGG